MTDNADFDCNMRRLWCQQFGETLIQCHNGWILNNFAFKLPYGFAVQRLEGHMEKTIMVPIAESIYEDVVNEAEAMNMTITEVVNYYLTVDTPVPNEYNRPIEEDELEDTVENRIAAVSMHY